jgi:TRAP-type C4-dicarboxylate transport system substrate-binding protein
MSRHSVRALAVLGLAAATLAGCAAGVTVPAASVPRATATASAGDQQAPAQDKAGTQTLTLHIATADVVNNNGMSYGTQAFVDDLAEVSGNKIKVDVITSYANDQPDAEAQIIKALQSGEIDGGWPAARAFGTAGIPALQALEAPMTISSIAAEEALVSGQANTDALAALKGTGLVGLSLLVGPLRRPFAASAPLMEPKDWQGTPFRVYGSLLQTAAVTALGGVPVPASFDWVDKVGAGTLRGLEFDIAQYDVNNEGSLTPFVTANEVMWPKVYVLALSQKRWDSLSDQQRAWVQQAADKARQASLDGSYDESDAAQRLCSQGVRFLDATPAQVSAMRSALTPIVDQLAADPASAALLKDVQAAAAQHPGVDEPDVPDSCRSAAAIDATPSIPTTASSLPDGTYRVRVTTDDVAAAGVTDLSTQGTWTLTIRDGTFTLGCRFISDPEHDCGNSHFDGATVEAGHLYGDGQTAYFVGDAAMLQEATACLLPVSEVLDGHCFVLPPYWFTWSLAGDQLTFSQPGGGGASYAEYWMGPWTRIN